MANHRTTSNYIIRSQNAIGAIVQILEVNPIRNTELPPRRQEGISKMHLGRRVVAIGYQWAHEICLVFLHQLQNWTEYKDCTNNQFVTDKFTYLHVGFLKWG